MKALKTSYNMSMYNSAFVFLDRALRFNDLALLVIMADEALGGMFVLFSYINNFPTERLFINFLLLP